MFKSSLVLSNLEENLFGGMLATYTEIGPDIHILFKRIANSIVEFNAKSNKYSEGQCYKKYFFGRQHLDKRSYKVRYTVFKNESYHF